MKDRQDDYRDDGHTIADMNIEGMPWYRKEMPWDAKNQKNDQFSREQTNWIIWGTVKAALLIAAVFLGAFFIFILMLCIVAWMRY